MNGANNAPGGSRWLEALIAPAELLAEASRTAQPTPEMGFGLLVELQLVTYERLADAHGWPRFSGEAPPQATDGMRFLAAVGREIAGMDEAREELAALASVDDADLALAAAVLAASAYAGRGDLGRARQLLERRLALTDNTVARQLLLIQLGVRAAEADDFEEAIARTREACGEKPTDEGFARTLWNVATWNLFHFEHKLPPSGWTVGQETLPLRTIDPPLMRTEVLLASGLDEYLKAEFQGALVNPYQRSIVWRAQDPVERGLVAALLRAESLGDWNGLGVARRALGRYRVLVGVARSDEALAEAFELLRRTGDDKGLGASARMIVRVGPLGSLRAAAVATVTARWSRIDRTARLALLTNAADLLRPDEAAAALDRVLEPEIFVRLAPVADKAAAALLAVVDAERHGDAAERLLKVPSLSTSGETLTIEESMTLRARLEMRRDVGDDNEWGWGWARRRGGGARSRVGRAGEAPQVHGEVQAGDPREGRCMHAAWGNRRAAAARGPVYVALDLLAQAAAGRCAEGARPVAGA